MDDGRLRDLLNGRRLVITEEILDDEPEAERETVREVDSDRDDRYRRRDVLNRERTVTTEETMDDGTTVERETVTEVDRDRVDGYRQSLDMVDDHIEMLMDHRRMIENHNDKIEQVLMEYDNNLVPNFREEYLGLMDNLIDQIEDHRAEKQREATGGLLKGLGSIGFGLASTVLYSVSGESLPEFYATSPELYSQNPESAILTVGLPVAGAYMLKKAFDSYQEQTELDNKKQRFQRARRAFEKRRGE